MAHLPGTWVSHSPRIHSWVGLRGRLLLFPRDWSPVPAAEHQGLNPEQILPLPAWQHLLQLPTRFTQLPRGEKIKIVIISHYIGLKLLQIFFLFAPVVKSEKMKPSHICTSTRLGGTAVNWMDLSQNAGFCKLHM